MNEHKLKNPFKTYDPTKEKLKIYEYDGIGNTTVTYTATEYTGSDEIDKFLKKRFGKEPSQKQGFESK